MNKTHKIAVIAGDGISNEVMPEDLRALQAAVLKFHITTMEWANCDYYLEHGWRQQHHRCGPGDCRLDRKIGISLVRLAGPCYRSPPR